MNIEELAVRLASWIREKTLSAGAGGVVSGMSGGIDSSVVAVLCQRAFPESSLTLIMPCYSNSEDERYAQMVAERFGLTPENYPKSVAFHTDERVQADIERGIQYYILEDNAMACGCVALERPEPEFCYMGRLAVLPECRRKGFGKALATRIFYEAWELGVRRVELGMIAEDVKLAEWYGRLGFVPNGTKQLDGFPFKVGFMVKRV